MNHFQRILMCGLLLLLWAAPSLTEAQCRDQSLIWGDDDFGGAVAIEDTIVAVGARLYDFPANDAGRVFMYRRGSADWNLEQELMAFDASAGAAFGTAVSVSPQVVVIGAPGEDSAGTNAGAVYIFRYNGVTWEPEVKITAPDASENAEFGAAVDIFFNTVVIGAPGTAEGGKAYVYEFDGVTWQADGDFTAAVTTANDGFGSSLAISANSIVVGAPGQDTQGPQSGAATIFRNDGIAWTEEATLTPPDATPYDRFGISVDINGLAVVVGAPGDDLPTISDLGTAYVFRSDGSSWNHEQKLVPVTPTLGGWFGRAVAMAQDVIVVGSPTAQINGNGRLTTFVYDGQGWQDRPETPGLGADSLRDGFSVGTSRGWAISGAPITGRAHLLEVNGPDCNGDGAPDRCQIANGLLDDCDLDEVPDLCGLATFEADSGELPNLDGQLEQQFVISSPPSAGLVTLAFEARGDLASPGEAIDVTLNGAAIGRIFADGFSDCAASPEEEVLTLEGALFDTLVAGGDATFGFTATSEVDVDLCPDSFLRLQVSYQRVMPLDCDASGVVDGCEILAGTVIDCDGDALPDSCEVATFTNSSLEMGPLAGNTPLIHVIPTPPAGSDVTLTFTATGDLGALTESVQIRLNGSIVGSVFGNDGADCNTEVTTTLVIPGVVYNFLTAGTDATFTLVPSATVSEAECPQSRLRFQTDYQRLMPDDCDGNGIPDDCDLASGALADLNGNGVPDACEGSNPLDCNGNGVPDPDDITSGASEDCDGNSVPDECDIGNGDQQDCDGDGAIDLCEIADGSELDCDGNGIPDVCNVNAQDCNNNGIFDSCEIEAGTVADCDENGVPDECLVAPILRSDSLSGPVGYQYPVVVALSDLPPAVGTVTLRLEVLADLGEATENAEAFLAGASLGVLFQNNGSNCPDVADIQEISLTAEEFNALVVDGAASLEVIFSTSVDPVLCDNPGLTWNFTYEGEFGIDLDGNGIPDGCEQPFQIDCDNDGIPNDVEIANGTATDCNNNDIPDDCEIDNGSAPDTDGDGVIDSCQGAFVRGDVDGASGLNIADAVALLDHLFNGGAVPLCEDAADANDDGSLNIGDPVKILQYLFSGGDAPVAPWPDCGVDPTAGDTLDCLNPPVCP